MAPPIAPTLPTTWSGVLIFIGGLVVLWFIVSIPVYFGGKIVKGSLGSIGDAMTATLIGTVAYFIVFYIVAVSLYNFLGLGSIVLGYALALMAWLYIYKGAFSAGWLGALGIVIVSWLVLNLTDLFLIPVFGTSFPNFIPF